MKKKEKQATALMNIQDEVWNELNICCGWSSARGNKKRGYSVEDKKQKHDALLIQKIKKLGYSTKNKVPEVVRQILENENCHTVNRILQERNLGEGNF